MNIHIRTLTAALILGSSLACTMPEPSGSKSSREAASPQRPRSEPAATAAPPRSSGDDGPPSPTQHWMGQAQEAGVTERHSEEATGSGDPDRNP